MRMASRRGVAGVSAAVASVLVAFTAVASLAIAQPSPLPNQQRTAPRVPQRPSTTPPGGDTVGYWQQRADYRIVATLDERRGEVVATGTLRYVNQSPDVLRELWGHQHLNAFRPGSKWSEADAVDDCARASTSQRSEALCVDESLTQWQGGRALAQARTALRWLEALYGDYPYPQITVLKRLDASGTEFPMLLMNGEASLGLTVHELGHVYTYGILANNEWQSGWLDEGLTSYQEALQAGDSRVLLAARLEMAGERDPAHPRDTVLRELRTRLDALANEQAAAVRNGTAEPIGTRADLFRSMAVYNASVYDRGQAMYQALHDVMGEELFQRFLRAYYATWQFRHVDRWAMQTVAEQTSAQSLGWFFTQWVQEVGVVDYALRAPVVRTEQVGGRTQWIVTASLTRAGRYRHPMPVGVRTRDGWTLWRANPLLDTQVVQFRLDAAPDALWLDPYGSTESPTARYYRISLPSR